MPKTFKPPLVNDNEWHNHEPKMSKSRLYDPFGNDQLWQVEQALKQAQMWKIDKDPKKRMQCLLKASWGQDQRSDHFQKKNAFDRKYREKLYVWPWGTNYISCYLRKLLVDKYERGIDKEGRGLFHCRLQFHNLGIKKKRSPNPKKQWVPKHQLKIELLEVINK